ncbi:MULTISPECIES: nuclear transport factor 2 family protein [Brevibacterium]|uniref:Nuclear transport factor 2 family protein n=2 Tax=Brevibacterium casei TaxID=33889 RepID=A0A7T4A2D2_9MICO|nr:nuclear transport factor 2 family protein [Brevibacterium casei]
MTDQPIPHPVSDFIEIVNAHDGQGFLDALAPDATVDDWGRTFTGRDEIKAWSDTEFIGSEPTLTPEEVSVDGNAVTVIGDWRSNHANGRSAFTFITDGHLITSMTIREG